MLQAASNIAPRGVYVCGNTTTTSGLTVTLSKDGSTGDYSLEAGALVLGDQGKEAVVSLFYMWWKGGEGLGVALKQLLRWGWQWRCQRMGALGIIH